MVKTRLKAAGGTDAGRVRRNNEDAWHVDVDRGIFLVVDGIGGQAAGEKAAAIAVDRVRARLERQTGTTEQRLREAIAMANNEILRASRTNPEWHGMACVLTVVVVENGTAVFGHVGDSRLYLMQGGSIRKLTRDHSPVGEREDQRELTEAEAMRHPRRNEVFRDVGSEHHEPDDSGFIDVERFTLPPDAALLLCSDGLSDQVPSATIRATVSRHAGNPEAAVAELIEAANQAGGKDNVTVVIVEGERFVPTAAPEKESRSPVARWTAMVAVALVLLAGGFFAGRKSVPEPPPPPHLPAVLTAGAGATYSTITDAIVAALPGDTVEVLPGEYREQLLLKTGVNLRSRTPLAAILRARAVDPGPAVIGQSVTAVRFTGFSIQGDAAIPLPAAIVLKESEVILEDLDIGGADVGIEIRGIVAPTLKASSIHDCVKEGILIVGASKPRIVHNRIQRNHGPGIAAREGARPELLGNLFEKNTLELPPDIPPAIVKQHNTLIDVVRRGRP